MCRRPPPARPPPAFPRPSPRGRSTPGVGKSGRAASAAATARDARPWGPPRAGVRGRLGPRRGPPPPPSVSPPPPPPPPRRGEGRRARGTRAHARAREDKPLCRGLTFNRSQRGSCSATYETPTQKQVVYEWFSARFPTNVRYVTGEGAAPFPAAPRFPGRGALRTGPRSRRAAGGAATRAGARARDGPPAGTAGDRLSEANRGSAALPYRSAWAGF